MAPHITNLEVQNEIRSGALEQNQSIAGLVVAAVPDLSAQPESFPESKPTVAEILELIRSFGLIPINDDLTEDEILGYGPNGYCE